MLMDQPDCMAKLVQYDAAHFRFVRRRGQPAVIHRRLRFGNGAAHRAQIRPRPFAWPERDPNVSRRPIDKLEIQVSYLCPFERDVLDTGPKPGLAVEKANRNLP